LRPASTRSGAGGAAAAAGPVPQQSPQKSQAYASDLVVVLDMDQCLVASHLSHEKGSPEKFMERLLSSTSWQRTARIDPNLEHWRFAVTDDVEAYVTPRPGVCEFLQNVTGRFETHVFTSARKVYADKVLDRLDPDRALLAGRWYSIYASKSVKDLNVIFPGRALDRMVLVDDSKFSKLAHPSDGVPIQEYLGLERDEAELRKVWELLLELDAVPDVRPILAAKFSASPRSTRSTWPSTATG
jgi:TFIIF-interacting CTD phosphatase-like protein